MPLTAAFWAASWFCSPKDRERRALTPTQVPEETAIIRFWMGKAMDTAVKAFSPSCATKMLSIMLYIAWTSIERIMGRDMVINKGLTGMTPILFCSGFVVALGIKFSFRGYVVAMVYRWFLKNKVLQVSAYL